MKKKSLLLVIILFCIISISNVSGILEFDGEELFSTNCGASTGVDAITAVILGENQESIKTNEIIKSLTNRIVEKNEGENVIFGFILERAGICYLLNYEINNMNDEYTNGEKDIIKAAQNIKDIDMVPFDINSSNKLNKTNQKYFPLFDDTIYIFSRPYNYVQETPIMPIISNQMNKTGSQELVEKYNEIKIELEGLNPGDDVDLELIQKVNVMYTNIIENINKSIKIELNNSLNALLFEEFNKPDNDNIVLLSYLLETEAEKFDLGKKEGHIISIFNLNENDQSQYNLNQYDIIQYNYNFYYSGNTNTISPIDGIHKKTYGEILDKEYIIAPFETDFKSPPNNENFNVDDVKTVSAKVIKTEEFDKIKETNNEVFGVLNEPLSDTTTSYFMNPSAFCNVNSFNIDYYDPKFCTQSITDNGCKPINTQWEYSNSGDIGSGFCCGNSKINDNGWLYQADLGLNENAGDQLTDSACAFYDDGTHSGYEFDEISFDSMIYDYQSVDSDFEHTLIKINNDYYSCKTDRAKELDSTINPSGNIKQNHFRYDKIIKINNPQRDEAEIYCNKANYLKAFHQECIGSEGNSLLENLDLQLNKNKFYIKNGNGSGNKDFIVSQANPMKKIYIIKDGDFLHSEQTLIQIDIISQTHKMFPLELVVTSKLKKDIDQKKVYRYDPVDYYPGKLLHLNQVINSQNVSKIELECVGANCDISNLKLYPYNQDKQICSGNKSFIIYEDLQTLDEDNLALTSTTCERYSNTFNYIRNGINKTEEKNTCCMPSEYNSIVGDNGACIYGNFISDSSNTEDIINSYKGTMFFIDGENATDHQILNYVSNTYIEDMNANDPITEYRNYKDNRVEKIFSNITDINYEFDNNGAQVNTNLKLKKYYPNIVYSNNNIYGCQIKNWDSFEQEFGEKYITNINSTNLFPELTNDGLSLNYSKTSICNQVDQFYCDLDGTFKPAKTELLAFHNFINDSSSFEYNYNISELVISPIDINDHNVEDYKDKTRSELNDEIGNLACCPTNSCFDGNECIENQNQFPSIEAIYSDYEDADKASKYKRDLKKNGEPYVFSKGNEDIPKVCVGKYLETKYKHLYNEGEADGWVNLTNQTDWTGNYIGHCAPRNCFMPEFLLEGDDYVLVSNGEVKSDHKYQTGKDISESEYRTSVAKDGKKGQRFLCVEENYFTGDYVCSYNNNQIGTWSTRMAIMFDQLQEWADEKSSDNTGYIIHCDDTENTLTNEINLNHGKICLLRFTDDNSKELFGIEDSEFIIATSINQPGNLSNLENFLNSFKITAGHHNKDTCLTNYENNYQDGNRNQRCGIYEIKGEEFKIILDKKYKIIYLVKGFNTKTITNIPLLQNIVNKLISLFKIDIGEVLELKNNPVANDYDRIYYNKKANMIFNAIEYSEKDYVEDDFIKTQGTKGDKTIKVELRGFSEELRSSIYNNIEAKAKQQLSDHALIIGKGQNLNISIKDISAYDELDIINEKSEIIFNQIINGIRIK